MGFVTTDGKENESPIDPTAVRLQVESNIRKKQQNIQMVFFLVKIHLMIQKIMMDFQ